MSKERYIEIGYYIDIGSIDETVRKRVDKFINSEACGASDNCLCQLLYRKD